MFKSRKTHWNEQIALTRQRIRRCEELLPYVISMCQIGTTSEVVAEAMATDIKFIYSELHSWKFTGQGIESYSELMSVIIQIKAALIENLNQLLKDVQS